MPAVLIAGILMALVIVSIPSWLLLPAILISCIVYVATVMILKVVKREDLLFIKMKSTT